MKPIKGNVISNTSYRDRITEVVNYVSDVVSRTLGPCGHTTLIQRADSVVATKDGWNVTQAIHFDNIIDNAMKSMVESCGQAVVLRVGDGSTTVIKAASELNARLMKIESDGVYTIREIETVLKSVVNDVIRRMRKNAIPIDESNMKEAIYNVAMVSTNWNKELSSIIADIYEKTHNPIIKVQESGTTETTTEIINGYELSGELLLPNFYLTDLERQCCELSDPVIFIFNHKIMDKYFLPLSLLGSILESKGQQFVVMAPDFDLTFLQKIKNYNAFAVKSGKNYMNVVPVTYIANFNIDKECVDDFAALCGAKVIVKDDEDTMEFFDDISENMNTKEIPLDGLTGDELEAAKEANTHRNVMREAILKMVPEKLEEFAGGCGKISISTKNIIIDGLTHKNEKLVNDRRDILKAEIDGKVKECDALTMLTDDIRQKRIRLGKLSCSMGIIKVGGFGKTNLKTLKDALDDATRACEAAYRDGYTVGSSIAIGAAITDMVNETDFKDTSSILKGLIVDAVYDSFLAVFSRLIENKGFTKIEEGIPYTAANNDNDVLESISVPDLYEKCCSEKIGFDILTDGFDKEGSRIINPVNVDIEVLSGCLRLVLNCFSSDQFVFTNFDQFAESGVDDAPKNAQTTMEITHRKGSYGV